MLVNAELRTDEHALRVRDRVLLYVRGMTLPTPDTLDVAAAALRRVGPDASTAEAMDCLRELLTERGALPSKPDTRGWPLMERGIMVAEELDRAPWLTAIVRFLFGKKKSKAKPKGTPHD